MRIGLKNERKKQVTAALCEHNFLSRNDFPPSNSDTAHRTLYEGDLYCEFQRRGDLYY